MAASDRPLNWHHVFNVASTTLLIGLQTVATGVAAGWALAGITQLGDGGAWVASGIGAVIGLVGAAAFFRSAVKAEPFR